MIIAEPGEGHYTGRGGSTTSDSALAQLVGLSCIVSGQAEPKNQKSTKNYQIVRHLKAPEMQKRFWRYDKDNIGVETGRTGVGGGSIVWSPPIIHTDTFCIA